MDRRTTRSNLGNREEDGEEGGQEAGKVNGQIRASVSIFKLHKTYTKEQRTTEKPVWNLMTHWSRDRSASQMRTQGQAASAV